ncbi:hypothetical protein ACM7VQ_03495 [Pseudomonas aeruginosa]|uniref:hypothetical protein n=1 Tax=Pseudomonas aeruginosa TaxID=287 RepID=UPI0003BB0EA1|nr:hypothetical protein [Pseudomonas aeruginosa]EKV8015121.1 hypothetical protein [Pseudomonas aeruginosa]ERX72389.1 hypothetical protein P997_05007 [Pseudomonas aeruginosa 62]ETV27999.1 hypothetical protein Q047_01603 [Pseudomonas aeruginosa BWHPSA042]MBG5800572.1 hypothetical protein [Pseudomonas aeruginosa]MBH3513571.1 hypothetical protein [Pseudomonas aeruginosa]
MEQKLTAELSVDAPGQAVARTVTSPECLSASVLTICQNVDHSQITEMISELKQQTAAIHADDLSRAESMLISQAHTLDGIFARLASKALTTDHLDVMERYMRLALKAQNQARATLQTLGELKAPKQIAFVKQANIGNQVQVNNDSSPTRTRAKKKTKAPNELLEVEHGERLDTRAAGTAGGADPAIATLAKKHRTKKP